MPRRGVLHSPQTRAQALKLRLETNRSATSIARELGVPTATVTRWLRADHPARQPEARARFAAEDTTSDAPRWDPSIGAPELEPVERSKEALSDLLYDTIEESLRALKARAIETGRASWIRKQSASELATLDASQWDRILRLVEAFEPAYPEAAGPAPALPEPRAHLNGTVDAPD